MGSVEAQDVLARSRSRFRELLDFVGKRAATALVLSVFAGLLLSGMEGALATYLQYLLKELGILTPTAKIHRPFKGLDLSPLELAFCLVALGFLRNGAFVLSRQCAVFAQAGIRSRLIGSGIRRSLRISGDATHSAAELNHRLLESYPRVSEFCGSLSMAVCSLIMCLVLTALMFKMAPAEAPMGLLALALVGVAAITLGKKIRFFADRASREVKVLAEGVQRVSRNRFLIRVFRTEKLEAERISDSVSKMAKAIVRGGFFGSLNTILPQTLGITVVAGLVLMHQVQETKNGLDFLGFLYLFLRFSTTLGGLAGEISFMNARYPEFNSAFEGFRKERELDARSPERSRSQVDHEAGQAVRTPASLELSSVSFAYTGREMPVFTRLSLSVKAGEHLGIMGKSGTGKSSLLGLMLGLLQPREGSIAIDGMEPRHFFENSANRVGYVGSEPFLFMGTIRENLSYGSSGLLPVERCKELMKKVGLGSLLESLPGGIDHFLNEGASGLSSGQRQKLSIARALALNPRLLILDEASSNLDEQSEAEIAAILKEITRDCTIVNVTHRKGMIVHADRVLNLA